MPEEKPTEQPTEQAATETPPTPTWDDFLAGQDDTIRDLYEQHVTGLKSALQAERAQRQELAKQLRTAAKATETGSEAQKALEDTAAKLEAAEARAAFFEDAARPEANCANPSVAYVVAREYGLIDKKGRVDWEGLRKAAPELFKSKAPATPGNAGAGTHQPTPAAGMNEFIRWSAGRE